MVNDDELMNFVITKGIWEGLVKRKDVCERYKISESKATKLFHKIRNMYPSLLSYAPEIKGYKGNHHTEFLNKFNFQKYLKLHSNSKLIFNLSGSDLIRNQNIEHKVYSIIHSAITSKGAIKFGYHSLNSPNKPGTRTVFPHALVNSGFRWHIRAYEPSSGLFKDFNIPRIYDIQLIDDECPPNGAVEFDSDWLDQITVLLVPNPILQKEKKEIIELDYGMKDGLLSISCKKALYLYTMRSLEVIDFSSCPSEHQHLAISQVFSISDSN